MLAQALAFCTACVVLVSTHTLRARAGCAAPCADLQVYRGPLKQTRRSDGLQLCPLLPHCSSCIRQPWVQAGAQAPAPSPAAAGDSLLFTQTQAIATFQSFHQAPPAALVKLLNSPAYQNNFAEQQEDIPATYEWGSHAAAPAQDTEPLMLA